MNGKFSSPRLRGVKIVPTRRTDYAIRALVHLAHQVPETVTAEEIATEMVIPPGFLHQVLRDLQHAGFLRSRTGRGGGYALVRDPGLITILDIVEACEGPLTQSECALRGGPCRWEEVCALHVVWNGARQALVDRLAAATLADVADDDRALRKGCLPVPPDSHRRRTPSPPRRERADP